MSESTDLSALQSDMQDVLYGAMYHDRYDTSAEAFDALLLIVKRYAAVQAANELRRQADEISRGCGDYRSPRDLERRLDGVPMSKQTGLGDRLFYHGVHARAAELDPK